MSSRHSARVSRAMVVVVGGTLGFAALFWAYNLGKGQAAASLQKQSPQPTEVRAAPPIDPGTPKSDTKGDAKLASATTQPASAAPAVLETPTTKPSGVILAAAVTNVSTTQPSSSSSSKVQIASAVTAQQKPAAIIPEAPANPAPTSLADAKAKMDAGQIFQARQAYNALVVSGTLSPADLKAAKQQLNGLNATVIFSSKRFPEDPFMQTVKVPLGGALAKIAAANEVPPEVLQKINGISDPRKLRADQYLKVPKGPFNAVVYKKDFTLELWLGDPDAKGSLYVTSFPVGLGKDDSTPPGTWAIINRLKNPAYFSPRGEGVVAADDPKNPLGEYWLGLEGTNGQAVGKTSYGIHGTIDPDSIGKQSSMGCIRLKNEDVAQVYASLLDGKSIVIVKD